MVVRLGSSTVGIDNPGDKKHGGGGDRQGPATGSLRNGRKVGKSLPGVATLLVAIVATSVVEVDFK